MEHNEQIQNQNEVIEQLMLQIAEVEQATTQEGEPAESVADTLKTLHEQLKTEQKKLRQLRISYDQKMLSHLVTKGSDNDEVRSWWYNRY